MFRKKDGTVKATGNSRFFSAISYSKEISGFGSSVMKHPVFSRIGKGLGRFIKKLLFTSMRTYGYFLASFGLISLLLHLAKYYFQDNPEVQLSTLIISAALAIVGIPLIFIDKPMCIALQDFAVTDYILFEFFSLKRIRNEENTKDIRSIVGAAVGIVPAVFAFFFPIQYVLATILSLILLVISLISPEFLFTALILAIPYLRLLPYSEFFVAACVVVMLVSFFRKVMIGKRVVLLDLTDVFVLFFVAVIIGFGIIGGGTESTEASWYTVLLTLGYIPAANIIVNRRLADCAANAFIIAAVPTSVYAVVTYIIGLASGNPTPSAAFMGAPSSLALFLLIAAAMCIFYIKGHRGIVRAVYAVMLVLIALALYATQCVPVLIVLPLSAVSYFIITRTRLPKEVILLLCAAPLIVFALPADALYAVSEFLGMEIPLGEMRGRFGESLMLFRDNIAVGLGSDAEVGANGEGYLFNTPLGIGCRFGIFALIAFTLLILFKLRRISMYSKYFATSSLRSLSNMTVLAIFTVLTLGWFYDAFANTEMYLVLFIILGMNTSALRVSKKEHDDMLYYYGDNRRMDSSDADITIKK